MALARALVTGQPAEAELIGTGLLPSDVFYEVDVWPEHQTALELFAAMMTQWRTGFNGPTGLDYSAVPVVMEMHGVPDCDRRQRFEEIRTMERAALEAMRDAR